MSIVDCLKSTRLTELQDYSIKQKTAGLPSILVKQKSQFDYGKHTSRFNCGEHKFYK